jgi:ABC-type polar amino acid transport system ATPase subunit
LSCSAHVPYDHGNYYAALKKIRTEAYIVICGTKVSVVLKRKESSTLVEHAALTNVSFTIPKQRITLFIGKNGAGKTTLLRTIAGLIPHYIGTITHQNIDIRTMAPEERAHRIGFVFQQFNLFPHMTAFENCLHPLIHIHKDNYAAAEQTIIDIFTMLDIVALKNAFPARLSGGQQQRVAIARAMVLNPHVLMLDEPTSALDPDATELLTQLLITLKKRGTTIALATHDMNLIRNLTDKIYLMHDGTIVGEFDTTTDAAPPQGIQLFLHGI